MAARARQVLSHLSGNKTTTTAGMIGQSALNPSRSAFRSALLT